MQVPPLIIPDARDARSPRLGRLGSALGSTLDTNPIDILQSPDINRHGSIGPIMLARKASMGQLSRTASTGVSLQDVPTLLFAVLLKKLHEQQHGKPLDNSDATIVQEVPHFILCSDICTKNGRPMETSDATSVQEVIQFIFCLDICIEQDHNSGGFPGCQLSMPVCCSGEILKDDFCMSVQAEDAFKRRSMLQRIMMGGDHRAQAVSFFQHALLHRLPTQTLR